MSQFTCLTILELRDQCRRRSDGEQWALLKGICSTISTNQLEEFQLDIYDEMRVKSINDVLAAVTGLRELDAILSRPQFSRLSSVTVDYHYLNIWLQELSATSDSPSHTSLAGRIVASTGSNSQHISSYIPGCAVQKALRGMDLRDPFRCYAQEIIRRKTEEELAQLKSRGILKTRFRKVDLTDPSALPPEPKFIFSDAQIIPLWD